MNLRLLSLAPLLLALAGEAAYGQDAELVRGPTDEEEFKEEGLTETPSPDEIRRAFRAVKAKKTKEEQELGDAKKLVFQRHLTTAFRLG